MKYLAIALLPMLFSGCQQSGAVGNEAKAATATMVKASATHPVVVELFQSQGCSSCPPADAALNAVAGRSDVIALNFSVTYWDRLGWKDIFGDPAYTQRQYDYAHALGNPNVYTPQMVINGSRAITGNRPGELDNAIANANGVSGGPEIAATAQKVTIGAGIGNGNVWLVRYDPRVHNVAIKTGENSGRTIAHKNIVRQIVQLGSWIGKAKDYALPKSDTAVWKNVILVQKQGAGAIISAKTV